jgi:hypothetical protein
MGLHIHSPNTSSWRTVSLLKHRDNFAFYISTFLSFYYPYKHLNARIILLETGYVHHDTWAHPSKHFMKHSSLCTCILTPVSLLGNGSINTFQQQRIHETIVFRRISLSLCVSPPLIGNCSANTFPRQRRIFACVLFRTYPYPVKWK